MNWHSSPSSNPWANRLLVVLPILAAPFFGFIIGAISPLIALMLGGGLLLGSLMVASPALAWVSTLLFAAQAIPGTIAPEIPLGIARLKAYELTFIAGLIGLTIQWATLAKTQEASPPSTATTRSTLAFFAVVISAIYGRLFLGNSELVLAETRPYIGLLAIFAAILFTKQPKTIHLLDRSVVFCGATLSLFVTIQLATGIRILDARVEDLGQSAFTGVTRSLTDTGAIAQAYAIYRLSSTVSERDKRPLTRLGAGLALLITILGLLGTFTRTSWIATAAGAMVAAFVLGGISRVAKTVAAGSIALLILISGTFVIKPAIATAMVERAMSVDSELESGASYGWRRLENTLAWESIEKRPLLGVGIGGAYKNEVKLDAGFLNDQYFIHNGYLYFPLKMGIPGLLIGIWLLFEIIKIITRSSRGNKVHAAQAGACAAMLLINIPSPAMSKFLPLFLLMTFMASRHGERSLSKVS